MHGASCRRTLPIVRAVDHAPYRRPHAARAPRAGRVPARRGAARHAHDGRERRRLGAGRRLRLGAERALRGRIDRDRRRRRLDRPEGRGARVADADLQPDGVAGEGSVEGARRIAKGSSASATCARGRSSRSKRSRRRRRTAPRAGTSSSPAAIVLREVRHDAISNRTRSSQKAPHPPYTDGPLPYDYGLNLDERHADLPARAAPAGARRVREGARAREDEEEGRRRATAARGAGDDAGGGSGGGDDSRGTLKDHSGQRPQVTMDDLEGRVAAHRAADGARLLPRARQGDHAFAGSIWRTTRGMFVAARSHPRAQAEDRVRGRVDRARRRGDAQASRSAWIVGVRGCEVRARRRREADEAAPTRARSLHASCSSPARSSTLDGTATTRPTRLVAPRHRRGDDAPGPPPKDLAPGEKWIDVNLSTQIARRVRGRQAGVRDDHLERPPQRRRQDEGSPHRAGRVPHPREAHRRDDGRRHGDRTARTRSRTCRGSCTSRGATRCTARSGTRASARSRATAA